MFILEWRWLRYFFWKAFLPIFLWPWWASSNFTIFDPVLHFQSQYAHDCKELLKPNFWFIFVDMCVFDWNNRKYHFLPVHIIYVYTRLSLGKVSIHNVFIYAISSYCMNILGSFDLIRFLNPKSTLLATCHHAIKVSQRTLRITTIETSASLMFVIVVIISF